MIWLVAKKEFHAHLISLRFTTGSVILLALAALFTFVLVDKYSARQDSYNQLVARNNEELQGVMTYQNLRPTVFRAPEPLAIFSAGLSGDQVESAEVSIGSVPTAGGGFLDGNPLLGVFQDLDISMIFQLVVTVLVLLLVYDSVSGEKENRTLSLVLSQGGTRHQVLLGKLAGCLISIAVPVTLAFLAAGLILRLSPAVSLSVSGWGRIILMYVASLLLAATFCSFGLLVSALTRRAADTLILLFFFWVLTVVVVPDCAGSLAERFQPAISAEKMESDVQALESEMQKDLESLYRQNRLPGSVSDYTESWGWYHRFAHRSAILADLKRKGLIEPLRAGYAEKKWQVRKEYQESLKRQKHAAALIALLSPAAVYESVMSGLARSDMANTDRFYEQARLYRVQLLDYLRDIEALSSLRYVTTAALEQLYDPETGGDYFALRDKLFEQKEEPLDLSSMPRFVLQGESLRKCLFRTGPGIALLFFTALIFYFCAHIAFSRYDVR